MKKKRTILLIIGVAILAGNLINTFLPSESFLTVYIDSGAYVPNSLPLTLIFSFQLVNMILTIIFGYLIYSKNK